MFSVALKLFIIVQSNECHVKFTVTDITVVPGKSIRKKRFSIVAFKNSMFIQSGTRWDHEF